MSEAPHESRPIIALALSGGGARAMAFHLGCLRALNDRGLLDRVAILSTVSGGSVIGACWAYWDCSFAQFDERIQSLLRQGIQGAILRSALFSTETFKIIFTLLLTALPAALIGFLGIGLKLLGLISRLPTIRTQKWLAILSNALPIWGSLSTAFEHALRRRLFGNIKLGDVSRQDLKVVINACDLRTQTAFRFGSAATGGWRYGRVTDNAVNVAKAVAASAAFPLLLPPLMETFRFVRQGQLSTARLVLTDGGVFDNLGVNVLEPGRDDAISIHTHSVTHIISANAGIGQASGESSPFWWVSRMSQSFKTVHRKVQDAAQGRLHDYVRNGALTGFGMIYLGQLDARLPHRPDDLVPREAVNRYPTDFAPMSRRNLELLAKRGEQLTHAIIDRYLADL